MGSHVSRSAARPGTSYADAESGAESTALRQSDASPSRSSHPVDGALGELTVLGRPTRSSGQRARAGGTSEAVGIQRHPDGPTIRREELGLAAYLAARIIDGRPVGKEEFRRLRSANISGNKTRQRLPHGRGNVTADLMATDGVGRWRAGAARTLAYRIDHDRQTPRDDYRTQTIHQAAAAAAFGAGNCGEYSAVAAVLHSDRLEPREELHIVASHSHQWTESRIGEDRARAVVLDGWAGGSPILADDGRFSRAAPARLRNYVPIPNPRGTEAPPRSATDEMDALESAVREQQGETGLRAAIAADARPTARLAAALDKLVGMDYTPQHVLDTDFTRRVLELVKHDPVAAQLAAAQVASQLGCPVESQRHDVQAILDVISNFPR